MGRYYDGDITGKFWFGVQSSTDGEYFGAERDESHIEYYVEDIEQVKEGLKECKKVLGDYKVKIDKFFKENTGYNDKMLEKYLNVDNEKVRELLEWYARLTLGNKIYKCIKAQGYCRFSAEL